MELKYLNRFLYWALQFILVGEIYRLPLLFKAAVSVAREETERENEEVM